MLPYQTGSSEDMLDPYRPSAVPPTQPTGSQTSLGLWLAGCVFIVSVIFFFAAWPLANTMAPFRVSTKPTPNHRLWWAIAELTQLLSLILGIPSMTTLAILWIKNLLAKEHRNFTVHGTVEPPAEKTSGQSDAP